MHGPCKKKRERSAAPPIQTRRILYLLSQNPGYIEGSYDCSQFVSKYRWSPSLASSRKRGPHRLGLVSDRDRQTGARLRSMACAAAPY